MSAHHAWGPTGEATVMLDIGDGVGALVLHTPSSLAGAEINVARRGETEPFAHTAVRPREGRGGVWYAAIYPALPSGEYAILDPDGRVRVTAIVDDGSVTEVDWESDRR
jgi:hypothetical protein